MALVDALLPEFDHEMATTRKLLERLPEQHLGWKPHERSMTLSRLATHLAELPGWAKHIICEDELDLTGPYTPREERTVGAILLEFDTGIAEVRRLIAAKSDGELLSPWTFKVGGKVMFTMPRAAVMRAMLFNHLIHHRGQLSVYLRLQNVPVPAIYGPSADEGAVTV